MFYHVYAPNVGRPRSAQPDVWHQASAGGVIEGSHPEGAGGGRGARHGGGRGRCRRGTRLQRRVPLHQLCELALRRLQHHVADLHCVPAEKMCLPEVSGASAGCLGRQTMLHTAVSCQRAWPAAGPQTKPGKVARPGFQSIILDVDWVLKDNFVGKVTALLFGSAPWRRS